MQTCSACQDLPSLPFWSKSHYPFWSYCLCSSKVLNFNTFILYRSQKLLEIEGKFKLQNVQHVKIHKKVLTVKNIRQLCEELFLLKCIFCWLSLLLVTRIIKGNNSITKCEVAKGKFWESLTFMFFTAMSITYIKGGTPAQIVLERGSAMTRATLVIFWPKLASFIDWCYYTQVSYTGSWEPLVT